MYSRYVDIKFKIIRLPIQIYMYKNIDYINENFIELNDLVDALDLSKVEIESLIQNKLIPDCSYEVNMDVRISSPLGDTFSIIEVKKYFPKNIYLLIKRIKEDNLNYDQLKADFKRKFKERLCQSHHKANAFNNLFDDNDNLIVQKFDQIFEIEWTYYCQGVYGICTKNATADNIIDKEIIIERIILFLKEMGDRKLSDKEKAAFLQLNEEFNNITSLFAPYQRTKSTRGKYIDDILSKNNMSEYIKKYN